MTASRNRGPVYRCTRCDRCEKPKDDCLWVSVPTRGNDEWCICGECRQRARDKGFTLKNVDVDYPEAAA